jgi:hypothetical protein
MRNFWITRRQINEMLAAFCLDVEEPKPVCTSCPVTTELLEEITGSQSIKAKPDDHT